MDDRSGGLTSAHDGAPGGKTQYGAYAWKSYRDKISLTQVIIVLLNNFHKILNLLSQF